MRCRPRLRVPSHRRLSSPGALADVDPPCAAQAFKGLWRIQPSGAAACRLSYSLFVRPQPWLLVGLIEGRIQVGPCCTLAAHRRPRCLGRPARPPPTSPPQCRHASRPACAPLPPAAGAPSSPTQTRTHTHTPPLMHRDPGPPGRDLCQPGGGQRARGAAGRQHSARSAVVGTLSALWRPTPKPWPALFHDRMHGIRQVRLRQPAVVVSSLACHVKCTTPVVHCLAWKHPATEVTGSSQRRRQEIWRHNQNSMQRGQALLREQERSGGAGATRQPKLELPHPGLHQL